MHSQSNDFGLSGLRLGREYNSIAMPHTRSAFELEAFIWLLILARSSKFATNALRLLPNVELLVVSKLWF